MDKKTFHTYCSIMEEIEVVFLTMNDVLNRIISIRQGIGYDKWALDESKESKKY